MKVFVSVPKNTKVWNGFLIEEIRNYLEENFEVKYSPYEGQVTKEQFMKEVQDCEVVLTGWGHPRITADMVKGTAVKMIAHTAGSVGTLIDFEIFNLGIRVLSGNQIFADSVAEGTIAYMLMGLRSLPDFVGLMRAGGWKDPNRCDGNYTKGLRNRTVGLIGLGAISKLVVEKLQVFGAKIKLYSSYPVDQAFVEKYHVELVTMEEALKCDVVSLHSALNEKTMGMIGAEQLAMIKDGALFVNTARGLIVDQDALIAELKKNRFSAVLDVYAKEPPEKDSPLRSLTNVYCVPHLAGPTTDLYPFIAKSIIEDIICFEKGKEMPLEITKELAARMTVEGGKINTNK